MGLLALQNNFIDRDALVAAFAAWVADKSRSLGDILLERGASTPTRHALFEALAAEHLQIHGGDPELSLAAVSWLARSGNRLWKGRRPRPRTPHYRVPDWPRSRPGQARTPYARTAGPSTAVGHAVPRAAAHGPAASERVYVGHRQGAHREVALKEIQRPPRRHPVSRSRFLLEAEITGRLEHPGIVPVYGLGTYADGRPYYAMRFIKRGQSQGRDRTVPRHPQSGRARLRKRRERGRGTRAPTRPRSPGEGPGEPGRVSAGRDAKGLGALDATPLAREGAPGEPGRVSPGERRKHSGS